MVVLGGIPQTLGRDIHHRTWPQIFSRRSHQALIETGLKDLTYSWLAWTSTSLLSSSPAWDLWHWYIADNTEPHCFQVKIQNPAVLEVSIENYQVYEQKKFVKKAQRKIPFWDAIAMMTQKEKSHGYWNTSSIHVESYLDRDESWVLNNSSSPPSSRSRNNIHVQKVLAKNRSPACDSIFSLLFKL
jgi:hypothetical protein